jgi:hypothetical protein
MSSRFGPADDADAICSASSVQSVSPAPLRRGGGQHGHETLPRSGCPTGSGMVNLGRELRGKQ